MSVSGFGDLAVAAKLGIYQRDRPNKTTRMALFGRVKMPTGDNNAVGPEGQALPKSLQLGTGSVDGSAGFILTHSVGPLGLSGDVIYDVNTESATASPLAMSCTTTSRWAIASCHESIEPIRRNRSTFTWKPMARGADRMLFRVGC